MAAEAKREKFVVMKIASINSDKTAERRHKAMVNIFDGHFEL